MNISSVGQHAYAGVVRDAPVSKGHQGSHCGCDGGVAAPPESREVRGESPERADRHHHGHGEGHERHGNGFGFGHYARGMDHFIQEQLRAARREVAGEQVAEAAAGLTGDVAGLIEASGRQDGLAAAQETFNTAIQDAVERFNSGEIGRHRTMAEFRAAYETLAEAVRAAPAEVMPDPETPAADAASVDTTADTAENPVAEGNALEQSLGQVFSDFMQGLRTDFAAATGMREFMSPENRSRILETFVELYRELAGADSTGTGDGATASGTVDQLA